MRISNSNVAFCTAELFIIHDVSQPLSAKQPVIINVSVIRGAENSSQFVQQA